MFSRIMALFLMLWLTSCTAKRPGTEIKVTNWNVQTFFDSVTTGNEYQEFRKSTRWNEEAYTERLKRLASAIKRIDADVLVMEEIENEKVMHDIRNFLGGDWDFSKTYRHGCFFASPGNSIGCGVLSRIPLKDMEIHAMDIRTEKEKMPRLRPLMKLSLETGSREFILLVNHWKSKSGGEENTEKWRNREEALLAETVSSIRNKPVIAAGDFNRDINDFRIKSGNRVLFRKMEKGIQSDEGEELVSLWLGEDGSLAEPGSYFFRGQWSRIDNFFCTPSVKVKDFFVETDGPWCGEGFVPKKYSLWNGSGYSDHLPVSCIVTVD